MKTLLLPMYILLFTACQAQTKQKTGNDAREAEQQPDTAEVADIWLQKEQRGVDFVAMGNEPSWSLEIDFEKSMIFTSLNEPDTVVTPVPEGLLRDNITATSFTAETENGSLGITISERPCADVMSGEGFEYTVSVSAKTNELTEAVEYNGCGRYLNSSPLNGAWQLVSVNNQKATTLFEESVPFLEFRVGENKLVGSGGCNRLSGAVELRNGSVIFSPIIATKMACPAIAAEQQLLNIISENELEFNVKDDILTLKAGTEHLVFQRMEQMPEK